MEDKPFSNACENNKLYILNALLTHFGKVTRVLEIGSGTGQHAIYFAANLPHIDWHCADQYEYHAGINAWINEFPSANLHRPAVLSFPDDSLPCENFDAVFTANTAHIMLAHQVQSMMRQVAEKLPHNGVFCQYGPFIIDGDFSSQSNQDFHRQLLENGCGGYRSLEELQAWAPSLTLVERITMPANNLLLVWHKR